MERMTKRSTSLFEGLCSEPPKKEEKAKANGKAKVSKAFPPSVISGEYRDLPKQTKKEDEEVGKVKSCL